VYDGPMPPAPKRSSESRATLHQYMMPAHANPQGNVHGGVLMKMMDEAAAISAMRHAQRPAVTIAIDSLTFKSPVHIGQLVTLQAHVTYVRRTSMEIAVRVHAEDPITGKIEHTNSAYFVFVALGDDGRPTRVPELITETDEERQELAAGERRQLHRLGQES
jgi:acyl-CoA hydrolase